MTGGPDEAAQRGTKATADLLDRAHLERQTFGEAALAQELLALFEGQCDKLLPLIGDDGAQALARADAAHTLKGGARAVGAFAVADRAEALEQGLRAGAVADDGALSDLRETIQSTRRVIAGYEAG